MRPATLVFAALLATIHAVLDSTEVYEDAPASWLATNDGSWTDRLGLHFKDDCQEEQGLVGLAIWLWSWATRSGQQRSGFCESKEMRCAAGSKLTALQVKYGRLEQSDRDLYDFRPRCGHSWEPWLGMKFPRESDADNLEKEAAICPGGASVTGIQVMRGRNDWLDQDYFNFKLRCGKQWLGQPLGLPFDGLRETRSATCPSGAAISGLRVHRGFQDWGDLDTYEFQLFCTTPPGAPRKPSSRHADDGAGGRDPRSSRKSKGSKQQQSSSTKQPPAAPARGGPSAFGSRAAEAEAAAAEVRAELARMRAQVKDEL